MGKARMVITLGSDYDTTKAAGLKARIAKIKGVGFVDFNYTNNKATMEFDPDRASSVELEAIVKQENKHCARSVAKPARGVKHASVEERVPRREGEHVCSE